MTDALVLFVLAEDTVMVPEFSEVRVPTEVMFGWALPLTEVATPEVETEPMIFDAFNALKPDAGPEKEVAVRPARDVVPLTARDVRVPWLVIAG